MKMLLIVYPETVDQDVMSALTDGNVRGYTKMERVTGEGTDTEPKTGDIFWPVKNDLILIAVQNEEVNTVKEIFNRLKTDNPEAGIRLFMLPMEELI